MSTTIEPPAQHPLLHGLDALDASLKAVGEANLWSASNTETLDALSRLIAAEARLTAAVLATIREVEGRHLADGLGMRDTASLLQSKHLIDRRPAARLTDLARRLDATATGAALSTGEVSLDHARVIVKAIAALPSTATVEERRCAEADLILYAGQLTPDDLSVCAEKIKAQLTIAPDHDEPDSEPDPDPAAAFRGIRYGTHRSGLATINVTIDPHVRKVFEEILAPLAQPEAPQDGITDGRFATQRRADAFTALVLDHDLGARGAASTSRAAVTVTIGYETLAGLSEGSGLLDDGTPIAPGTLRTLLCGADILPVVLGGASEILDLGRTRRLHTHYQHRALAVRDGGCTFGACAAPPSGCHDHHTTHWAKGGPTTIRDGALLCPRHHRQVHREGWDVELAPNGYPRTIPPRSIDPTRTPRQHPRFRTVQRR
jgi:hypothetical protein